MAFEDLKKESPEKGPRLERGELVVSSVLDATGHFFLEWERKLTIGTNEVVVPMDTFAVARESHTLTGGGGGCPIEVMFDRRTGTGSLVHHGVLSTFEAADNPGVKPTHEILRDGVFNFFPDLGETVARIFADKIPEENDDLGSRREATIEAMAEDLRRRGVADVRVMVGGSSGYSVFLHTSGEPRLEVLDEDDNNPFFEESFNQG